MNPTRDTLWRGALGFWQPPRGQGYRFNLDPVLLAGFMRPTRHVLDLGAGVGVLGVLLLASGKAERVTAVEVQPLLAELARRNARDNGLASRLEVVEGDLRAVELPAADAVAFNPPYFRAQDSRGAPERGRDAARHERHGTLADFVRSAARSAPGGLVTAIVPSARRGELEALLAGAGASGLRLRAVVSRPGAVAERWLVEASLGGAPAASGEPPMAGEPRAAAVTEEPPLVVHGESGRDFSPEVRALLHEE